MGSASVPDRPMISRRYYCCNECHRKFNNKEELFIHAEACINEAFESEVIATLNDVPFPAIRNALVLNNVGSNISPVTNTTAGFGITVKKSNDVEREEFVTLKLGEGHSERDGSGAENHQQETSHKDDVYHPKLITYSSKNDDVSQAQTIEGPNGLKVMVSVEANENTEAPPTLSAEGSPSIELTEGESNTSELDGNWEGGDNGDSLHECSEDREIEPGTSFNSMKTPHVIGALANAVDDPYKPKMECPTCGLVLYRHNFSTHYRIHTGELPFFCEFCPKRFRTSSSLKVHVRAHTGEKPYICPMCGYSTITKRNLDRHIENHHVRLGGSKGPATRKSRYRENMVETEWMDDLRSHAEPRYERNVSENIEDTGEWDQADQHGSPLQNQNL